LYTFSITSSLPGETFDVLQTREVKSEKREIFPLSLNNTFSIDKPLQFSFDREEISYLSYVVVCRSDGVATVIHQDVLGDLSFNHFRRKVAPVFTKTVNNLLNIRNHLLLQLDLECGNISEEYFDKEEPKYLSEFEKIPPEKLKEEINILFGFTNLPFDSVDISEILNCSVHAQVSVTSMRCPDIYSAYQRYDAQREEFLQF